VLFEVHNSQGVSIKHLAPADNDEVIVSKMVKYRLDGMIKKVNDPYDGDFWYIPLKEVLK